MMINKENYEEYAIDYLEGTLDAKTKYYFEEFLMVHPEIKKSLETLMEYQLPKDETIVFDKKEQLYKRKTLFPWLSLAASLIFIIGLSFYFFIVKNNSKDNQPTYTIQEPTKTKNKLEIQPAPENENQKHLASPTQQNNVFIKDKTDQKNDGNNNIYSIKTPMVRFENEVNQQLKQQDEPVVQESPKPNHVEKLDVPIFEMPKKKEEIKEEKIVENQSPEIVPIEKASPVAPAKTKMAEPIAKQEEKKRTVWHELKDALLPESDEIIVASSSQSDNQKKKRGDKPKIKIRFIQ
jgi:hypothetical protein